MKEVWERKKALAMMMRWRIYLGKLYQHKDSNEWYKILDFKKWNLEQ